MGPNRRAQERERAAAEAGAATPGLPHPASHLRDLDAPLWRPRRQGLIETDRWADIKSTARYAHAVPTEAAKRADLLPVPKVIER
jgi:hypothetical protein